MPFTRTPASMPGEVSWKIGRGEGRTYTQTELSIDSEVVLLGVVARAGQALGEQGFPFDRLSEVLPDDGDINWTLAIEMLDSATRVAPAAMAEVTTILLGVLPTNEDGARNPDYDSEVRYVRHALTFANFVDVVQVFAEQNDYRRLAAPFVAAMRRGVELGVLSDRASPTTSTEPSTPSSPRATGRRGRSAAASPIASSSTT